MKIKRSSKFYIMVLFLNLLVLPISSVYGEEASKVKNGVITCESDDVWNDDQWQFYKFSAEINEPVYIQLNYSGELDLDLRLYWNRENPAGFNGFDLSHCSIDNELFVFADNSQLRTHNTTELGQSEELVITNPSYTLEQDKVAYILIFSYSGEGSSNYVLTSTKELTLVEDDETYDCNSVMVFLFLYLALAGLVFGLFTFFIYKKNLKITGRKKKKGEEEEGEKPEDEDGGVKHVELDTIVR